ncbi:hypothetical protein K353_04133 [Kitasatospora sp. SolWspMP-SS2h]|nr:hypothetical protein K353_04133 [Kitasatospora sp. SolWspMP-SS2h]
MTTCQPNPFIPPAAAEGPSDDRPAPKPGMTIRVYTVRADGSREQVSFRTSDEPLMPAPRSTLTWPACGCPRCIGSGTAQEPDAA